MADKTFNRCNRTYASKHWARHLRSQKHQRNEPDQKLRPRARRNPEEQQRKVCDRCNTTII